MAEIEISEVCYTAGGEEETVAQEMEVQGEQNTPDTEISETKCVIVGTVAEPAEPVVTTTEANYSIQGFTDSSVRIEHVGDVPVKFEIPDASSVERQQFAIFEGNPVTTVASCIAQPVHPTYSLENFADSSVKVEPVDNNGPVQIFREEHDMSEATIRSKMEEIQESAIAVTNGSFEAIPVSGTASVSGQFEPEDTKPIVVHKTEGSTISDEQFRAMENVDQNVVSGEQFETSLSTNGEGQAVENMGQTAGNDGQFAVVTTSACVEGIESAEGQMIQAVPVSQTAMETAPQVGDHFHVVTGDQAAAMESAANTLAGMTEEQISTLSTPEGLINVVQSLGDVQSVGDGQFTLVTPDGLLSVVNPESESGVSAEGTVNVTTENGIQYAILSTPEGLVKVALNAPEGVAAGVLVADENGQLVLQNVSGGLDSSGENALLQLPVQFADQHDQAVLQANGLLVQETMANSGEDVVQVPVTTEYAETVTSSSIGEAPVTTQAQQQSQQQVQEQPQIEPECFEIYTVGGNQEQVISNPPEAGMVEVVSYTETTKTEGGPAEGVPGPSGYAISGDESGSEPEFVSVEPPSITSVDANACVLCGKKFPLKEDLSLHLRLHARETVKTYDCLSCDAKFARCWLLRRHIKSKHNGNGQMKVFCPECGEVFEAKDRLCSHMWKIHKKRNAFPCNCLDLFFNTSYYLKRHQGSKYCPVEALFCNICNDQFDTKDQLSKHMEANDDRIAGGDVNHDLHTCRFCKRGFTNSRALEKHEEGHKQSERTDRLTCHKCGDQFHDHSALMEHTLRAHMRKKSLPETYEVEGLDSDSGNHMCNICGGRFNNYSSLMEHLDAHIIGIINRAGRPVKTPPLFQGSSGAKQCPYCKKDCHTLKRFNNHYCIRPGTDGRYPCQYCTKIFTNLSSVYSHLAWHRREEHQMMVTEWPEQSADSDSSDEEQGDELQGGMDTMFYRDSRSNYKCRICGRKFKTTSGLQLHMASHKKGVKRRQNREEEAFRKKQRKEAYEMESFSSSHARKRTSSATSPRGEKKKLYRKDNSVYKCKVCDKVFVKFLSLCGHLAAHKHDGSNLNVPSDSDSSSDGEEQGMVIDFDSAISNFSKQERVVTVRRSPTQRETLHECNICGKVYTRLRSLASHKRSHGDDAKLFACSKCGAKFSSQEAVLLHKQACRYENQSCSCVKCGGKFPNFGELKDHLPGCLGTSS